MQARYERQKNHQSHHQDSNQGPCYSWAMLTNWAKVWLFSTVMVNRSFFDQSISGLHPTGNSHRALCAPTEEDLLPAEQLAYWAHHSTEDAVLLAVDQFYEAADQHLCRTFRHTSGHEYSPTWLRFVTVNPDLRTSVSFHRSDGSTRLRTCPSSTSVEDPPNQSRRPRCRRTEGWPPFRLFVAVVSAVSSFRGVWALAPSYVVGGTARHSSAAWFGRRCPEPPETVATCWGSAVFWNSGIS